MAQVTYQAAGTGSQAYGNLTPAYPAGLAANDLILLHVKINGLTDAPTTPTGFTLLFGPDADSGNRSWIYYKISTGSESGTITVTISGSPNCIARMYSFRNNATTSFNEGGGFGSGATSTISMQSVVTTVAETLAVSFINMDDSSVVGASTGESGGDWIEAVAEFNGGNGYQNLQLQIATMATAGTISGGSFTATGTTSWGNRAFAIKPAAGATPINISDSGSGADAISLAAVISQADSGSGSDVTAIAAALSQSDAGAGADAISLAAQIAQVDSGSGSDVTAIAAALSQSDSGAGADAISLAAQISQADSGSGADSAAIAAAISQADSGLGNDALTLAISLTQTDNGSGTDDINVNVSGQVSINDIGSGSEIISLAINASINDVGGGADDIIISVSLSANDSGAGADILDIAALIAIADSGIGEDILGNIAAMVNISEIIIGAESIIIEASLNAQDAGTGVDNILVDTGAIVAAIIKMASVTLTQPKMASVTLTQPKMHDIKILN